MNGGSSKEVRSLPSPPPFPTSHRCSYPSLSERVVHPLFQLEAEAYRLDSVITAAVASVDSRGSSYPSQESVGFGNDTDAVPPAPGAAGSNLAGP